MIKNHSYLWISLIMVSFSPFSYAKNPLIIAHRAGTADAPENTVFAIDKALKNKADIIWISVQLSRDIIPVLYRPSKLDTLTNKAGKISGYTAQQLHYVDAAYKYNSKHNYIYKNKGISIPTLKDVLAQFPNATFFIDLKSPDANPEKQANAINKLLKETDAYHRTRFYSTNYEFLQSLKNTSSKIALFESRDYTRDALASNVMNHVCWIPKDKNAIRWYGFELHRKVEIVEHYTLGEARSPAILTWNERAMDCFRGYGNAYIALFGVNSAEDYALAKKLGADAIMVDSPKYFNELRKNKPSQ